MSLKHWIKSGLGILPPIIIQRPFSQSRPNSQKIRTTFTPWLTQQKQSQSATMCDQCQTFSNFPKEGSHPPDLPGTMSKLVIQKVPEFRKTSADLPWKLPPGSAASRLRAWASWTWSPWAHAPVQLVTLRWIGCHDHAMQWPDCTNW